MNTNAPVETKPAETKPAEPQQTHAIGEFKHTSPLLSCRFDPSGQFVFATAYDNTIQRWQLASGKATSLVGHDSWVRALAFHPSGSTLYSGGYDGRVIWWEPSGRGAAAETHAGSASGLGPCRGRQSRRQAAGHRRQRQPGEALERARRRAAGNSASATRITSTTSAFIPTAGGSSRAT